MNRYRAWLSIPLALLLTSGTLAPLLSAEAHQDSPPGDAPLRLAQERASRNDTKMFVTPTAPPVPASAAPTAATSTTSTTRPRPKQPPSKPEPYEQAKGHGDVVQIALNQVGKSYAPGATGPGAFDCSGLVFYVFNQAGVRVPRLTSDGYYARYAKISRSELQPGDLVVSSGHIGIYVGNGQMVHASTPRGGVKRASMDAPRPFAYVRIH